MNKTRSLFIAANPHDTDRLNLDREIREITSKICSSKYRDSLELIPVLAAQPDDLLQALNHYPAQIVHFSGHGSPSGEIILVNNIGLAKPISRKALKKLFTVLKNNVRLVILNACDSRTQAEAIIEVIDCAVVMKGQIADEAAITFIASFYRAIGFGHSIREAFDQGVIALELEGFPEDYTPELFVRSGIDPKSIFLVSLDDNYSESDMAVPKDDFVPTTEPLHQPSVLLSKNTTLPPTEASPYEPTLSDRKDFTDLDIRLEKEHIMQEIRALMSEFIPDFDSKFPVNAKAKLISEIRDEKIFHVNKARALVFGETGVGKTTTINFLLSTPIFPTTGELSCTKSLASVEHKWGLVVYDSPGIGDRRSLENVTRSVLGIELIAKNPINDISLIDVTSEHLEGPSDYITLNYEQYSDQISKEFYEAHKTQIIGKKFNVNEFSDWAAKNIDFFVFVASSQKSLTEPMAEILGELSNSHKSKAKLFKVFNVFDGNYRESVEQLNSQTKTRFAQTLERSEEFGLNAPNQWFMIDSINGQGIAPLISAFADTLPPDVLRSLEQVIKRDYAHLIHKKLESIFLDYVARIASVVAVFPADYETEGEDLLHFTINSIVTMAEFLFPKYGQNIASDLLDELVGELKSKSEKRRYKKEYEFVKKPTGNWFKDTWRGITGTHEKRRVENYVFDGYYTAIGGVKAIKFVLSLGLTLKNLYSDNTKSTAIDLREMIKVNLQIVQENFDHSEIYYEVKPLLVRAGKKVDKNQKLELASGIYVQIQLFWDSVI